jgi:two-component sensor histidine kinase
MHRAMHHDDERAGFRATATGAAGTLEAKTLRRHLQNHTRLILGLLALQADRLGDPDMLREIGDLAARALGTAHERIDHAGAATVELAAYLRELGDYLARFHPGLGLDVTADTVAVATSDAVTLGLIVNELVADGAEQALTEGPGQIRVELGATGADEARLTLIASGRAPSAESGLHLIEELAAQLGAELAIASSPRRGMRATVAFPLRASTRPACGR